MIDYILLRVVRYIPRRVLYWCVIQAWVYASTEKWTALTPQEIDLPMTLEFLHPSVNPQKPRFTA